MGRSMSEVIDFMHDLREEFGFRSIWSAEDFTDRGCAHPFPGVSRLVYEVHWGPERVVVPIMGPTYKDLWAAAEAAINASGDAHHIFIEVFRFNDKGELEMFTSS